MGHAMRSHGWGRCAARLAALAAVLVGSLPAAGARGQEAGQSTFAAAEDAAKALYKAARGNDEKALLRILGPDGKEIISSGDGAEDRQERQGFAERYQEMHRLVDEPDGTTTLLVGPKNWPSPIPLVQKGESWYFDTAAGKAEILQRRVGRNEVSTIHVLGELVAAEKEVFALNHEYASTLASHEPKHDGLYWKTAKDAAPSPIGPLLAAAGVGAESKAPAHRPTPFHGYYYRVLTAQGDHASGGSKSYLDGGKMIGGFALLAYPAEYGSSGLMSFLVGDDGVVEQQDLGEQSASVAKAISGFDPDPSWQKAEGEAQAAASEAPVEAAEVAEPENPGDKASR
jgi:hypothetical protein